MKNQFNLNIENKCSEDFSKFTTTKAGGFCDLCKQEVVDFTKMNSDEIANYFSNKSTNNLCGRFKANQLTAYEIQQPKRKFGFISGFAIFCLSLFSGFKTQAQEIKQTSDDSNKTVDETAFQENLTVKGVVSDDFGPIAGANVVIKGTLIGKVTDFDGNFELTDVKPGSVLIISFVGKEDKEIKITKENVNLTVSLEVNLNNYQPVLMGKVATKGVYSSKNKE